MAASISAGAKWAIALVLIVMIASGIAWIYYQQSESDRRRAVEQARQEEADRQARKNEIAQLAEQERQARRDAIMRSLRPVHAVQGTNPHLAFRW